MHETPHLTLSSISFERDDIPLFSNVEVDLFPGDILQVEGPNGSGKTTLLRIISTALTATTGDLLWKSRPVTSVRHDYLSSLLFMGHAPAVNASLTPEENLRWWRQIHQDKNRESEREVLARIDLHGYEDVPCYSLSAGQQRRVALARMLVSPAKLWVLDEPFTAIDKQGVKLLESLMLNHISKGGMVILSTHQILGFNEYKRLDLATFTPGVSHAG